MWKCPKCKYRTTSYRAMQKHYGANHSKRKKGTGKGGEKKVYTYKPPKPPK